MLLGPCRMCVLAVIRTAERSGRSVEKHIRLLSKKHATDLHLSGDVSSAFVGLLPRFALTVS